MLSTKSRLETSPPGAKKRTSSRFSGVTFGTAGQTSGRSNRDTMVSTGWREHAVVEAVARHQLVLVAIAVDRKAQLPGEAVLVEDEGLAREPDGIGHAGS